jgi:hypothetical protein
LHVSHWYSHLAVSAYEKAFSALPYPAYTFPLQLPTTFWLAVVQFLSSDISIYFWASAVFIYAIYSFLILSGILLFA